MGCIRRSSRLVSQSAALFAISTDGVLPLSCAAALTTPSTVETANAADRAGIPFPSVPSGADIEGAGAAVRTASVAAIGGQGCDMSGNSDPLAGSLPEAARSLDAERGGERRLDRHGRNDRNCRPCRARRWRCRPARRRRHGQIAGWRNGKGSRPCYFDRADAVTALFLGMHPVPITGCLVMCSNRRWGKPQRTIPA